MDADDIIRIDSLRTDKNIYNLKKKKLLLL